MRKTINKSNWIDITKQLPPEGESVIIIYDCCGEPNIDIMKRSTIKIHEHTYENHFENSRGFLTEDVTHWIPLKPLPKMYQEMLK